MNPLALIAAPETEMRVSAQPLRVVGIDLGTTNSTIAEILWRVGDKVPEGRCLEVEQPTRQEPYWSGRAESLTKSVQEWDACGGADLIQVKEAGV